MTARLDQANGGGPNEGPPRARGRAAGSGGGDDLDVPEFVPRG